MTRDEADGGTQQGPTEMPSLCQHQRWRVTVGTRSPVCRTTGRRPHSSSPALGTASRPPLRGRGLLTPAVAAGRLTCVAVGPLHVQLHVALLREAHDAVVTLVRPLPRVLLHVHLQRALLVEGLLTERAVERPLPCRQTARSAPRGTGARGVHTHTHTHTHTHGLPGTHIYTHRLPGTQTHTGSQGETHTHTHTHTQAPRDTHTRAPRKGCKFTGS